MIFYSKVHPVIRAGLGFIDLAPYFVGGAACPSCWLPDFVPDTYEVATALEAEILLN